MVFALADWHFQGRHHRQEPIPVAYTPICRLGRRRHGLAFRHPLRVLMGTLRLDRYLGDLALVESTVRHRPWRVEQLVCNNPSKRALFSKFYNVGRS